MLTVMYDYVMNPSTSTIYSSQQLIEQLAHQHSTEEYKTDLTGTVSVILSIHGHMGPLGLILQWAKEMKE